MSSQGVDARFGYSNFPIAAGPPPVQDNLVNYLSAENITIGGLHWFTSDQDIVVAARKAGVHITIDDVVFAEHKVNGKSKCMVTVYCRSPEKASMLVHWFAMNDCQGKRFSASYLTNGTNKPIGSATSFNTPRPLANLGLTGSFATNAHGGINFNRLRPHNRHVVQTAPHGAATGPLATVSGQVQGYPSKATGGYSAVSPEPDWMGQWYAADSGLPAMHVA